MPESALDTIVAALEAAHVRYIVVGGVAVVLHGFLRTTADLDLVVQLTADNVTAAVGALAGLGYRPLLPVSAHGLGDEATRRAWTQEKGLIVLSFWSDRFPGRAVDLFVQEPFDFDAAFARALRVPLHSTTASVAALSDLIALKERAGRPLDLEDIRALRALSAPEPADGE